MTLTETLTEVPLLAALDGRTRRRIAERGKRRVYRPGDRIIRQGDPASALYILLRGRVRVLQDSDGSTRFLTELVPYSFFGEAALVDDMPRSASVQAVTETECLLLPAWEFTALVKEYPEVADLVLRELIRRLNRRQHVVC